MKRLAAWLLCALLALSSCAAAENTPAFTGEEAARVVQALFAAAAGTDYETETELEAALGPEEYAAHTRQLAALRQVSLPYLAAALAPEDAALISAPAPEAAPTPPPWRAEDAHRAFSAWAAGSAYLDLMGSFGYEGAEGCLRGTRLACAIWLEGIDAAALEAINPDYACWLYCPDSPIDYPVVQGEDNSYYLKRLFNGERNAAGTLFIDFRNLARFQDPNTLIYGHHMRNGSMFKSITYYNEQAWYNSHPFMLVAAPGETAVVEVLAGYLTDEDDHCYDIALSDDEDMRAFIDAAREKSDFATPADILPGDRLITLSTCAYAFRDARYVLIGRMQSIWRDETALALPVEQPQ